MYALYTCVNFHQKGMDKFTDTYNVPYTFQIKKEDGEDYRTGEIINSARALERMGMETSQLALARCAMHRVLGRERSRGRTVEKWRVKTKFCSTYKVHCYR